MDAVNFADVLAHAKRERDKLDALIVYLEPLVNGKAGAPMKSGRQKPLKGTDALVFDAIKNGDHTVDYLVKSVKVQVGAIRQSIKRLIAAKRVEIVTGSWPREYQAR